MAETAIKVEEKPVFKLRDDQIHVLINGYTGATFEAHVPPNVTPDDLLVPECWAHIVQSKGLRPGNKVEVSPHDRTWFLQVWVIDVGPSWAKVRKLSLCDFRDEPQAQESSELPKGYSVQWQGPINKYVVTRDSDKAVIAKGFKTKPEAQIAMIEHARAL